MNVLALDIGDARVGIASGNDSSQIATPLKVLSLDDIMNKSKDFQLILQDYLPEKFVIGLPKSMDGEENVQAAHVKDIADEISLLYGLPVEFVDERLSSVEAKAILREQGLSEKEMRGKVDSVAASLFLETWLDQQNRVNATSKSSKRTE